MKFKINKSKLLFCAIALFTICTTFTSCGKEDDINIKNYTFQEFANCERITTANVFGRTLVVTTAWKIKQNQPQVIAVISVNDMVVHKCSLFPNVYNMELKANKQYAIKVQAAVVNKDGTLTITETILDKKFKTGD